MIGSRKIQRIDGLIGRVPVRLRSDLQHVSDDFDALYGIKADSPAVMPYFAPIEIEVRRAGRSRWGRALYRVTADGYEVGGRYASNGVFPLVEWGINLRIMATRNEFLQLHAASMAFRGNGFIFAGDTGSGKSTLAASLLVRGWQYLCDEFALVRPQSLTLEPFPKAICIKAGSYDVVRRLGLSFERCRDHVKAYKGRVGYINPRNVGRLLPTDLWTVLFVVLPNFKPGQTASLQPVSRAEAATELYRCCFNKAALPECGLATITSLVTSAQCFRLTIGSPSQTAVLLECLVPTSGQKNSAAKSVTNTKPQKPRITERVSSRREMLKVGAKLAYVAPSILTLTARQAFAAASNPSAFCSTASHAGELCETDMDCCSGQCNLGVCK